MDRIVASIRNDQICLQTPFAYKEVCKSILGARWKPEWKCWAYPAACGTAMSIVEAFPPKLFSADAAFTELLKEYEALTAVQAVKTAEVLPPIPITKTEPWHHQTRCFWHVVKLLGGLNEGHP